MSAKTVNTIQPTIFLAVLQKIVHTLIQSILNELSVILNLNKWFFFYSKEVTITHSL